MDMLRAGGFPVREHTEEWKELCRQAAAEQDPRKLLELTRRINELLTRKQRRLDQELEAREK